MTNNIMLTIGTNSISMSRKENPIFSFRKQIGKTNRRVKKKVWGKRKNSSKKRVLTLCSTKIPIIST